MKTFLLFFLFLSFNVYAHEDMILSFSEGNIHMEYKLGWDEFEIKNKVNILMDLSAKLVKEKGYTSDLYIYFNHAYTQRDSAFYMLGYGAFTYWEHEHSKSWKEAKGTGLTLIVRDRDMDIKKMLNLINSAFENTDAIKKHQSVLPDSSYYSVPADTVKKYLNAEDILVKKLLQEKTYRHAKPTEINGDIDYYYQNNQFHFYNSKQWGTSDVGDLLVTDHIHEIVGNSSDGHFIFINDSVFYYLPSYKEKKAGPFTIDSIEAGRPPIRKYEHASDPLDRFTLFIETYDGQRKVVFFPDSNLVISNFDKLENDFIKSIFDKQTIQKNDTDTTVSLYVILIILALSIALNVWLWMKRR